MTPILSSLADLDGRYDALFCDLWGCLHDGIRPFPAAVEALKRFRAGGGVVVLLTNSPKPRAGVEVQLAGMGIGPELYDTIASSGDAALDALASGDFGQKVWHLGGLKDASFFEALDRDYPGHCIERVALEEAEGMVITGLADDTTETPGDYRLEIAQGVNAGLKMLCANPDILVDKGNQRLWCAGSLAQAYTAAGGDARYFGKPHKPIYDLSLKRLEAETGRVPDRDRVLCVGDGIITDVQGAMAEGLDSLFITGGLARDETETVTDPVPEKLRAFVAENKLTPTYALGWLR